MSGTIQCPQCGAASSAKVSETEYHCAYCESNFTIGMSKEDMIANILKKVGASQGTSSTSFTYSPEKIAEMRAAAMASAQASKKGGRILLIIFLAIIISIVGVVAFSVKKATSGITDVVDNVIKNSTVSNFKVMSGSKGPVIWMLQEQSASMQDSTHFILSIIDPQSKKHLEDLEYLPAMTWEGAFNSGKYLGEFYAFGDTCWIVSEHFGLTARDIYTGKILIDSKKLSKMHPELEQGITKAEWGYSNRYFSLTTNDGFEFIFLPDQKKIFKKEDFDNQKRDESKMVKRNFFMLSESKRPGLFVSVENTSPFATSSQTYSGDLENANPHYKNRALLSLTHILPDLIFFNGYILHSDNDKTLIAYQNTVAKNSALHFSCIDSNGKVLWNISGKEIEPFEKDFSDNNRAIDFVGSKNVAVLFTDYADHDAIGIDWTSGKILWQFSTAKK